MLANLAPRFQEIAAALLALTDLRERPADSLRIGASGHAAATILLPALARDTVALPIGPDLCLAALGAPARTFAHDGNPVSVRIDGQIVCTNAAQTRLGLTWVLDDWCAPFALLLDAFTNGAATDPP